MFINMRSKGPVQRTTFIRHLPYHSLFKLQQDLDLDGRWRKLMNQIPESIITSTFQNRYSAEDAMAFEQKFYRQAGSPTQALLSEWSTQNATVDHLLQALIRADLRNIAHFVITKVLNEEVQDSGDVPPPILPSIEPTALPPDLSDIKPRDKLSNRPTYPPGRNDVNNTGNDLNTARSFRHEYASGPVDPGLKAAPLTTCTSENFDNQNDAKEDKQKVIVDEVDDLTLTQQDRPGDIPVVLQTVPSQSRDSIMHISYDDIRKITKNFNEDEPKDGGRLLGRGGFGTVYLDEADIEDLSVKGLNIAKAGIGMRIKQKFRFSNGFVAIPRPSLVEQGLRIFPHCEQQNKVVKGIDGSNRVMAIKALSRSNDHLEKHFKAEVSVLSRFAHPHILTLLGYSCDGARPCIVFELMCNGSLEDRLACKYDTEPLSVRLRVSICQGTAQGIHFLNSNKQIHRDVKSANILLDKKFVPKLGDFATIREGPSGAGSTVMETSVIIGTNAYLAPEAHNFDVSSKLDSFSFGVVLLELLTGLPALDMQREDKDLRSHVLENYDDHIMDVIDQSAGSWSEALVQAIFKVAESCLEFSKNKRLTVTEVLPSLEML